MSKAQMELLAKARGGVRPSAKFNSSNKSNSSDKQNNRGGETKSAPPKPKKTFTKPGDTIKTSDGKEIKTSEKKPTNERYSNHHGTVGDTGYNQRFHNYDAPVGSTVYYPRSSVLDYLPWIYLFSQNSPANQDAVVVQPDGKEVQAEPVKEGVDGLAVLNWIILIVLAVAVIAGVVWGVNRYVTRKK